MKAILSTLFLILSSQLIQAQTYQPYPFDNASWTIYSQLYNGQTYIQDWETKTWSGDTIIGGQTYTRVFDDPNMIGVRQEISNEKIYYIDDQGVEYDASFDQSVQVGDTVQITPEFKALNMFSGGFSGTVTEEAVITGESTVLLGSTSHRKLSFESITPGTPYDMSYICGVGSTNATTSISSAFDIECYYVDGYQLIGNQFNPYCTADIDVLLKESVSIYPNPSEDHFFINYDSSFKIKEVHLLDITGKRLAQFDPLNAGTGFDISNLPKGMYVVELVFDQGQFRTPLIK